ncbi:NACHT, LRR and PYD domains-containing protein 3-like isoform X2 [Pseudophryne corroboree]|uniref:NACHT, LRR and PYD domains-containing protein 3-like isoform X2 n=1 Tax=Pseudophryne corroboree TaxID=495146 RepID=UPI003081B863
MATSSKRARYESSRTLGDILYEALADLTHDDFKRFKDKLSDFIYRGQGSIPRGRLEKSNYVTTKNLLIDAYGEEAAMDVTKQVLQLISLMGPAEDLQHKATQHDSSKKTFTNETLEGYRITYVDDIREKYEVTEDHNARLGEYIKLEKRYVTLLLIKNYRDEEQRQHEIISLGERHLQIMANRSSEEYSPTPVQALFDPDVGGIIPRTVVLQGPAGIGKTMTTQKIMLDWASGNLYKDKFQFVFYISCREVNTITGNLSLAGYLSNYCLLKCRSDQLRSIFLHAEKILFIVDGFDELKWSPMSDREVCDDPFQEVSKEILLNSLFRKKILKKSYLIITTRPLSLMALKGFAKCIRYVEILGFTGNQREEYFYHFFQTKEQADLVISTIKDNDTLYTMCAVPVICWIVCTVMKPLWKQGFFVINCKTVTSIYLLYLKSLILYHGRDSAQHISTCIQKLSALANEGVWDQRILFEESDLVRHGLSVSEVESVFLNENIFHKDVDTRTCYSFIHLTVQEFFAALYYVLDEKHVQEHSIEINKLLEVTEHRPHLKLTVRFLFGLSNEKQNQETLRAIKCPISLRGKPVLDEFIKRKSWDSHSEILCCLYETQDEDYVERMMSHFLNVELKMYRKKSDQKNIDYRALAYCLEKTTIQHTVTLEKYVIGPKARSVLPKALSICSHLRLYRCDLTSSCCDDLRSVITTNRSLTRLELSYNAVEDPGVKLLCEGLRHPACTLQDLRLHSCGLTSSCCDDLRSVITTLRSLTRLDLSDNVLGDSGINLLCEGLRHPACALQELRLCKCDLTSSCCDDFCSVITTLRSLTRLVLSHNDLEDSGIKLLCEGLRHPDCALQDLWLPGCDLTSSCCDDLRSVITTNRSLTRLVLSWNALGDSGIKLLCEGLRHPACTLQDLWLLHCSLTSSCCDDLRSVITTRHSLTTLALSWNVLEDSGIKLMCEGLRHPACTLQDLRLCECNLTSSCCDDLRSVLTTSRSLTRLDLSGNALGDSGIQILCEGLRHSDCVLLELRLLSCGLTSSCCDDLRSVLTTNRSLTRLNLSGNALRDSGIKLLCEGLRHPACSLQDLRRLATSLPGGS